MFRVGMLAVLCALAVARPAAAQIDPEPKDGKVTFAYALSPAAAQKPLSDHHLLVEYRDRQPGDMLSGFMKCFMEQAVFYNSENSLKRHKLLEVPLAELPSDVREKHFINYGIAYNPRYATMMVLMD